MRCQPEGPSLEGFRRERQLQGFVDAVCEQGVRLSGDRRPELAKQFSRWVG